MTKPAKHNGRVTSVKNIKKISHNGRVTNVEQLEPFTDPGEKAAARISRDTIAFLAELLGQVQLQASDPHFDDLVFRVMKARNELAAAFAAYNEDESPENSENQESPV